MFTYERECSWCKPSKYVSLTTIERVEPAMNADKLDVCWFKDIGYQAVIGKGQFKPGDEVLFIPGETLIPTEMAKELNIEGYLSHSRVKTIRLRKNLSEGVVVEVEKALPYMEGLLKWEDQEKFVSSRPKKRTPGIRFREWLCPTMKPKDFCRFYDMPNLLNATRTFYTDEPVYVTEKIHGMNARFAVLPRKFKWWAKWMKFFTRPMQTFIGSHNVVLSERGNSVWHEVFERELKGKIPPGYVFFGEVYGRKTSGEAIQKLTYGATRPEIKLFAAFHVETQVYLHPIRFKDLCIECCLPFIEGKFYSFDSVQKMKERADAPSELTDKHIREGIVIHSMDRPGVFAKVVSPKYLEDNNRTEGKQ